MTKAGQGTGATEPAAIFQAWEAVLQATDWGSWATWMAGSQKPGEAPGWQVENYQTRCKAGGGLGHQCTAQARLCKAP